MKSIKIRLELNNKQESYAKQHCGVARHAWNWALGLCKEKLKNAVLFMIEFSDFNVKKQDNTALIAWTTAHEDKGDRFEIQRSNNGVDFQTIHQLEAKGRATIYRFDDTQPLKNINYYGY